MRVIEGYAMVIVKVSKKSVSSFAVTNEISAKPGRVSQLNVTRCIAQGRSEEVCNVNGV